MAKHKQQEAPITTIGAFRFPEGRVGRVILLSVLVYGKPDLRALTPVYAIPHL